MRRGVKAPRSERKNTVKNMITAAVGSALLSGALLGVGTASAECLLRKLHRSMERRSGTATQSDDGYEAPASILTTTASPAKKIPGRRGRRLLRTAPKDQESTNAGN